MCQVVSNGPFVLAPNDSIVVAFALLAGDNLADIQQSADSASAKYFSITNTTVLNELKKETIRVFPNPFLSQLCIDIPLSEINEISIYNNLGQPVLVNHKSNIIKTESWPVGIYYLELRSTQGKIIRKKIIKQ